MAENMTINFDELKAGFSAPRVPFSPFASRSPGYTQLTSLYVLTSATISGQ